MDRAADSSREMRIEAERRLLAAICQKAATDELRAKILRLLKHHRFADPDNEVIYRALTSAPIEEPANAPQALLQAVTRLGFPDIEIGWLFTNAPTDQEIPELLSQL